LKSEILKRLSANDVGETGGHQAGILVPKNKQVLAFFPILDPAFKNPRMMLTMREEGSSTRWQFNYIYYNSKMTGGTRNEYRLTCMTKFLWTSNAKSGDELRFSLDEDHSYVIGLVRAVEQGTTDVLSPVLVLSGGWKVINY